MPKIKILESQVRPAVPKASELSKKVERFQPSGKPPLPLDKSFNRQGTK